MKKNIIHILPQEVALQIAAGEVVNCPASVVKELLENAIDAEATQIQVILRESGKELIQIIDNGKGMSADDAVLAFERHATSKISQATDLYHLHTMGFRGEALASITAVAEVTLRTRCAEDEVGCQVQMNGGQLISQKSIACPVGTNIQVRNLFYNMPVRRRFLKSEAYELSAILKEIQRVALANPQVSFQVEYNGKAVLEANEKTLSNRIQELFGQQQKNNLIEVNAETDLCTISGYVGTANSAQKKGQKQFFFVNDRYMYHPKFAKAVAECYEGQIAEGQHPDFFLYLQVNPESIDVNIHPTKTEIKFENESAVRQILMDAVRQALAKYNEVPVLEFLSVPQCPGLSLEEVFPVKEEKTSSAQTNCADFWLSVENDFQNDQTSKHADMVVDDDFNPFYESAQELEPKVIAFPPTPAIQPESSKLIQTAGSYIVVNSQEGLVLIDQHAAHVAVLFDHYYQQIKQQKGVCQQELYPELLELNHADAPIMEKILPQLGSLGFSISHMGGFSYAINGKPASLEKSIAVKELILEMIEMAREEQNHLGKQLDRKLALKMSKAQAYAPKQTLSDSDMMQLVTDLYSLPDHKYSPDGRPITSLLSAKELAARF